MSAPGPQDLRSVGDLLRYATTRFAHAELVFGHGTDNPWDEAIALIAQTLGLPVDRLEPLLPSVLLAAERDLLLERIERRIQERLPLPYLTGEAIYAGLSFIVTTDVLVPRSPIFELLESDRFGEPPQRILDLCCGSGALGIVAAGLFPDARIELADINSAALEVARQNVVRFGLEARVRCVQSDVWDALDGEWDLIISNPPYVAAAELMALPPEYHHEPAVALAAGSDGLAVAARVVEGAAGYLDRSGMLIVEVGDAALALVDRFPGVPFEWPDFGNGGHGVGIVSAGALRRGHPERAGATPL